MAGVKDYSYTTLKTVHVIHHHLVKQRKFNPLWVMIISVSQAIKIHTGHLNFIQMIHFVMVKDVVLKRQVAAQHLVFCGFIKRLFQALTILN